MSNISRELRFQSHTHIELIGNHFLDRNIEPMFIDCNNAGPGPWQKPMPVAVHCSCLTETSRKGSQTNRFYHIINKNGALVNVDYEPNIIASVASVASVCERVSAITFPEETEDPGQWEGCGVGGWARRMCEGEGRGRAGRNGFFFFLLLLGSNELKINLT